MSCQLYKTAKSRKFTWGGEDMYPLARYTVNAYNPSAPIYSVSQVCLTLVCSRGLTTSCREGSIIKGSIVSKHASRFLKESLVTNCTHYAQF